MDDSPPVDEVNPYEAPRSPLLADLAPRSRSRGWLVEGLTLTGLAVAAAPLALISNVYIFAGRAALFLGRWPRYNNPDPKSLPDDFHPASLWLAHAGPWLVFASFLAASRAALHHQSAGRRSILALLLIPAACAFVFGLLRLDPGGVFDWFFD